jgi:DNA invertase Pin-like site-specific DNA recombinase
LDVQLGKLDDCDKIFQEKKSGRTDNRPQLKLCLDYVRDGDVFIITKLDRLARSTRDLLNIVNTLESKGVTLQVLDQKIDTSTALGRMTLTILGVIAEFENDIRLERQADGIKNAISKGVKFGRKATLSPDQVQEMIALRKSGVMIKDLMEKFSLSKASVYRLMNESVVAV